MDTSEIIAAFSHSSVCMAVVALPIFSISGPSGESVSWSTSSACGRSRSGRSYPGEKRNSLWPSPMGRSAPDRRLRSAPRFPSASSLARC